MSVLVMNQQLRVPEPPGIAIMIFGGHKTTEETRTTSSNLKVPWCLIRSGQVRFITRPKSRVSSQRMSSTVRFSGSPPYVSDFGKTAAVRQIGASIATGRQKLRLPSRMPPTVRFLVTVRPHVPVIEAVRWSSPSRSKPSGTAHPSPSPSGPSDISFSTSARSGPS
jgi:hypothetical protein